MSLCGLIPFVFGDVSAQPSAANTVTLEVGALAIQQLNHASTAAGSISLYGRHARSYAAISAYGLLLQASDNLTGGQGSLGIELALPTYPALRLAVAGTATRFGGLANDNGSSGEVYVRPQFARSKYGTFATISAGNSRRDSLHFHALSWDAGAWAVINQFTANVALRRAFTNDFLLLEASDFGLKRRARHYAVQDVEGSVTARVSRVEFVLSGATRRGIEETFGKGSAVAATSTFHITPAISATLSGGRQLADIVSGIPAARTFGVSLRATLPRRGTKALAQSAAADSTMITRGTSPFATTIARRIGGGAVVTVRIDAPASAKVEVSGTFNDWAPIVVSRGANGFEHAIELPGGTHRIAVRVDGGQWEAPVGLARIKDDLGGEAGLIVVP